MPESDHPDDEQKKTNKDADDVESAALQSFDVTENKAQDRHKRVNDEADVVLVFENYVGECPMDATKLMNVMRQCSSLIKRV
jgi:hypothetical protein